MILVADIQRAVADLYGLPVGIMREPDGAFGSRERRTHARPRQVAMFLARQLCSPDAYPNRQSNRASLCALGRRFGGRDHTTVLHGCRTIERLMHEDSEERRAVGEVALFFIERQA